MSYEGDKYEYKFLVFSILNGPKNMIDNLNAEGDEGWTAYDNLSISDDRIVIEPKEERERALSSLWGGNE